MKLYDHQLKAVQQLKQALKAGSKSPLICVPCGGGKTVLATHVMQEASLKGNESLFLVDRQELYNQTIQTLRRYNVDQTLAKVSMITHAKNNPTLYNPKIIFADECNFSLASTWQEVLNNYPNAIKVGLSATPVRLDGTRMINQYDSIVQPVQVGELINLGLLARYKYLSVHAPSLEVDLTEDEIYDELGRSIICDNVVENFRKHAHTKQTIVFCSSIAHSEHMAERFRSFGYSATHIDANTPAGERAEIIAKFKAGEIQILCNVFLLCYGFDAPSCKCVVLLAKTASYAKYHQSVMRAMRPHDGEQALILDFVANVNTHGLPDSDKDWDLTTGKNKNEETTLKIKQCPNCHAWLPQPATTCTYCDYSFAGQLRQEQEQRRLQAELKEYQAKLKATPYSEAQNFTTWEQLVEFQKAKKYKFFWCIRQAEKLNIKIPYKYQKMTKVVKRT